MFDSIKKMLGINDENKVNETEEQSGCCGSCGCKDEDHESAHIRYRTFNVIDSPDGPTVGRVIAVTSPLNDDRTEFQTQFSYCSPKDKFDRRKGQFVAYMRMTDEKSRITFKREPEKKVVDHLRELILKEAYRKDILWLRDVPTTSLR